MFCKENYYKLYDFGIIIHHYQIRIYLHSHHESKYLFLLKIKYTKDDGVSEEGHSGIVLPRTMFDTLSQEQRKSIDKITLLVFRDPKLFSVSITKYIFEG